ncbi:copper resistance CopC family protein [Nostocoides jenkinsii]|uniref:Putative Copper resistance protein CopC n=1 Tax=Nostocoides jenkinsii Ben 74 TaxID=1193518 RepID=A0A077MDQ4_9MICO|nr:copper resistance protein CopC [Tetrasphaera jenkinsii]CCI54799.1 putative Copper resistance protein CopC [Tetrasphaera jenkinsii Ben 74]
MLTNVRSFVRAAVAVVALMTLAVVTGVAGAGSAYAHTELLTSTPAANAKVEAPTEVTLGFSEDIKTEFATVQVTDGEGLSVADGDARVSGPDLTQALRTPVHAGTYLVAYKVTSADGHPVSGSFSFTVVEAASSATSTSSTSSAASSAASSATSTTPSATATTPDPRPMSASSTSASNTESVSGEGGSGASLVPIGAAILAVILVVGAAVVAGRRRGRGGAGPLR